MVVSDTIMSRAWVVTLAALLAACAGQPETIGDTAFVHMSADDIHGAPASLSGVRYLSTGQPDEAVLDAAADAGFVAVIDVRGLEEDRGMDERAEVEARGMQYVSFPVTVTEELTYDRSLDFARTVAAFDGPVLMHCISGNRVGSLVALAARAEGLDSEAAFAKGEEAGLTRWRKAVAQKLEVEPPK